MKPIELFNILLKLNEGELIKIRYFVYDRENYFDIIGEIQTMGLNKLSSDITLKNFYVVDDKNPTELVIFYQQDDIFNNLYAEYIKMCRIKHSRIIHIIPNYDRVRKIKKIKKGI